MIRDGLSPVEARGHTGPSGTGRPCYKRPMSISSSSPSVHRTVLFLHKGMREPNFGSVDGTIAGRFDEGQVIGISGIEDDAIDSLLFHVNRGQLT